MRAKIKWWNTRHSLSEADRLECWLKAKSITMHRPASRLHPTPMYSNTSLKQTVTNFKTQIDRLHIREIVGKGKLLF